jgi:phosphohistidine phosphatase
MKVYFLRHADALDGEDDAARPLSPLGKEQSEAMAKFLTKGGVKFAAAYTSPLVRAHQTAEIVLRSMGRMGDVKLETVRALLNETSETQWNRWLKSLPEEKHVLFVGHAPSIDERVRAMLSVAHPNALTMPKGAVACIATDDRHSGRLKYLVTPKSLGF